MSDSIQSLFAKLNAGDTDAARKLIEMQRSGKQRRMYPRPRRGPDDSGDGVVMFRRGPHHTVQMEPSLNPFIMYRGSIGHFLPAILYACAQMRAAFLVDDWRERLAGCGDDDMQVYCAPHADTKYPEAAGILMAAIPIERDLFDMNYFQCGELVLNWLSIMQSQQWSAGDCNVHPFTMDLAEKFAVDFIQQAEE